MNEGDHRETQEPAIRAGVAAAALGREVDRKPSFSEGILNDLTDHIERLSSLRSQLQTKNDAVFGGVPNTLARDPSEKSIDPESFIERRKSLTQEISSMIEGIQAEIIRYESF